ncbi:MAG: DegT/DnrJ/EryC1/StrS family aminotransferase [Parcubacteria group bacterium]
MGVPFLDLKRRYRAHRREINSVIQKVFERGYFVLGPEVEAFEKIFSKFIGSRYTIGVNSGTDALILSMKVLDIGAGDEVITISYTAPYTVHAIRLAGAKPILIDVDSETMNIDISKIQTKITKRTKAIIPVHLYGYPADMKPLVKLAKKYNLYVIEDAAQAIGAQYYGKHAGTYGIMGCFSFYPVKNLGAVGDAGAIVTNDNKLAIKLKAMRTSGETKRCISEYEGVSSRLDELQAGYLKWGMTKIRAMNARRREIANMYIKELRDVPIILPPKETKNIKSSWHLFVIRTKKRDQLQKYLAKHGVSTLVHYPVPVHEQPIYRSLGYTKRDLPVTVQLEREILSLPLFPELTNIEVHRVCTLIKSFYRK